MTTATWSGGIDLQWFTAPNWSGLAVPLAGQDVLIAAAAVTIDSSTTAAAANVTLGASATLDLATALVLGGTLSGGTLDLAGTLDGGTLENTFLGRQGGTLLHVTMAGTLTNVPIGLVAIDQATAASFGASIPVYGTLTLEPGLYDNLTFAGSSGQESLAGAPAGPVTLGSGSVVRGLVGLAGDLVNEGQVGDGVAQSVLRIGGAGFTNAGTLSLADAVSNNSTSVGGTLYQWTEVLAVPTVAITSTMLSNTGLITLPDGTLTVAGAGFRNAGSIVLADGTTELFQILGGTGNISDLPLASALDVAASVTSFANTGTISAGTVDFAGPVSLAALGAISGALRFDGTLDLGGGTLDASAYGSVVIDGLVENGVLAAGSGTLTLAGATLDGVSIAPGGAVTVEGPIALVGLPTGVSSVTLDAVTTELALTGSSSLDTDTIVATATDTLALTGGTVTLGAAAVLTQTAGTLDLAGPGTLEDEGAITVAAGTLVASAALVGAGTIAVAAGATLTESALLGGGQVVTLGTGAVLGAATLGGSADVTVGAGATLVVGTFAGDATVSVDPGARVTIEAMAGTPTLSFGGGSTFVVLPGTGDLPVILQNLAAGDLLDFADVSSTAGTVFAAPGAAEGGGTLDVTGASGDTARVAAQNAVPYLTFSTSTAGGGTLVTPAACFRAGTRIATARGAVPVERLRVGDLIRTATGRLAPAVWIGRRRIDCRRAAWPEEVWPVRIAAHAFAPGRPARDLHVSPDHALWCAGRLVPARYLLNGATIAQVPVATVDYWHVELPVHGLLLAENLPAESYLDTGNRAAFERTPRRAALPPASVLRIWRARARAALLTGGPKLAALHARLLARAQRLGHALTGAPALLVVADPAGGIRLRSRSFVPAHLAGHGGDPRRLGIAVRRVRLDGVALPLDDPRLGAGWHAPEGGWRWTGGDASIAAAGAREVAIEVAMTGHYWRG